MATARYLARALVIEAAKTHTDVESHHACRSNRGMACLRGLLHGAAVLADGPSPRTHMARKAAFAISVACTSVADDVGGDRRNHRPLA